ncbi:MAG: PHP domain-containing protein, partial [Verrucomicrobiota bacterium]
DMGEDQISESLLEPTDLETDVYCLIRTLLRKAWKRRVSVRLVSLKLSNVYRTAIATELALLPTSRRRESCARLVGQVDVLRKAHGQGIILRAHDMRLRHPPRDALVKGPVATSNRVRLPSVCRETLTYVPLRGHSHYSFLDSTLSPTALVGLAKQHGLPAVALTDTGNLHGATEFVLAAKDAGIKPIVGAELNIEGKPLLLYAESATGYHNLCRLLSSHAKQMADSGEDGGVAGQQRRQIHRQSLIGFTGGLIAVGNDPRLADLFPNSFYRMVTGKETDRKFSCVAAPPVHYADMADRQRYDILQSIRTLTLLREQHPDKRMGGRLHFRSVAEMNEGCKYHPEWLRHTLEIAER